VATPRQHRTTTGREGLKMRLGIGVKLALTFGLVIVLSAVNVLIGMNGLRNVVATYENEALRITETARLTENLEKQVFAQGHNVSTYLLMGTDNYAAGFFDAVGNARQTAERLLQMIRNEAARRLV